MKQMTYVFAACQYSRSSERHQNEKIWKKRSREILDHLHESLHERHAQLMPVQNPSMLSAKENQYLCKTEYRE